MSTTPATARPLSADAIDQLRRTMPGRAVLPGDEGYDASRVVWNAMIDHRPAVIVEPSSTDDVVAAVAFAREQGLPVAIRGGGHNAAGLAVCDDGLVVDLRRMRGVEVDHEARTARAQGGATWADFDAATQAHGLATTGGAISMTGIAGLTLGGGLGNLMRSYGLSCDNLLSAQMVTAAGQVVTASGDENAELFWGLRGGGGNFGVVTAFTYRLHPVSEVLGGMLMFPIDRAPDLLRVYREVTRSAPDALTTFFVMLSTPDGTPVCAVLVCYNGPIEEGERAIKPVRDFGPPIAGGVGPMPYLALQSMLDEGFPSGMHVYWRSHFLTGLDEQAGDVLIDHFGRVTSPLSAVLIEHLGGAVARVNRNATAFDHREADFNLAMIGRWADPADADRHIAWTRGLSDAMLGHARGVYVNYLGVAEGADRVRSAYGDEKFARLVALKDRYDPTNLFRFNQNIPPSA